MAVMKSLNGMSFSPDIPRLPHREQKGSRENLVFSD
jgi:hypothetical protein